jgi:hypothetical protein
MTLSVGGGSRRRIAPSSAVAIRSVRPEGLEREVEHEVQGQTERCEGEQAAEDEEDEVEHSPMT